MIPFKQKTNSILKNTAVLIILLCLSDSCFSYLQDYRRTTEDLRRFANDYQRQITPKDEYRSSATALQRESVDVSPYIRDVRADSRQSRIDARDIRTDFREIRTELRSLSNTQRNGLNMRYLPDSRTFRNQEDSRQTDAMFRDFNNNIRNEESSRMVQNDARNRRDVRDIRDDSRQYQNNYSRQRLQRQLSNRRNHQEFSNERREIDSMRQNYRIVRERSQDDKFRRHSDEPRQIRDRQLERISEDRRDIREKSRDSKNVRERSDNQRTTSRYDERRFERTSQAPQRDSRNLKGVQSRSNARITARGYNTERFERASQDWRELREDTRKSRDVQKRYNNKRYDDRHAERADRLNVRELVRNSNNARERSSGRIMASQFDTRDDERQDFTKNSRYTRHINERSVDRRSATRHNDRRVESRVLQNREHSQERSDNLRQTSDIRQQELRPNIRQEKQRIRDITSERRANMQGRFGRARESSNILRQRENNVQHLRKSRFSTQRLEDSRSRHDDRRNSEIIREWSRTLRESRGPTNNRRSAEEHQTVLRERRDNTRKQSEVRREYSRQTPEHQETSTGERNSHVADRRIGDSRTIRLLAERREDSRINTRDNAQERTEHLETLRDRRETGRVRESIRNSRQNVQERENSERRKRLMDERREIIQDSRETETRNIRDVDLRRVIRDPQTRVTKIDALRNVEFIPHFKEKTTILTNTLQAVIIVALFGQIFLNTSKNRLRFTSWQNLFGKEKAF